MRFDYFKSEHFTTPKLTIAVNKVVKSNRTQVFILGTLLTEFSFLKQSN